MANINVIEHDAAKGLLKDTYDHLVATRGKLAEVHKIQSLNPPTIMQHMDLYMGIMFGQSPLKRYQREMMAVVVSKANNCPYCQVHHAEALNFYWKDEAKTDLLKKDYTAVSLSDTDRALCDMAVALTLDPGAAAKGAHIDALRKLGVQDKVLLDATLVVAYFNFVNRIVLNLQVELGEEEAKEYEY